MCSCSTSNGPWKRLVPSSYETSAYLPLHKKRKKKKNTTGFCKSVTETQVSCICTQNRKRGNAVHLTPEPRWHGGLACLPTLCAARRSVPARQRRRHQTASASRSLLTQLPPPVVRCRAKLILRVFWNATGRDCSLLSSVGSFSTQETINQVSAFRPAACHLHNALVTSGAVWPSGSLF